MLKTIQTMKDNLDANPCPGETCLGVYALEGRPSLVASIFKNARGKRVLFSSLGPAGVLAVTASDLLELADIIKSDSLLQFN